MKDMKCMEGKNFVYFFAISLYTFCDIQFSDFIIGLVGSYQCEIFAVVDREVVREFVVIEK